METDWVLGWLIDIEKAPKDSTASEFKAVRVVSSIRIGEFYSVG